jgi:hypothetical protein
MKIEDFYSPVRTKHQPTGWIFTIRQDSFKIYNELLQVNKQNMDNPVGKMETELEWIKSIWPRSIGQDSYWDLSWKKCKFKS